MTVSPVPLASHSPVATAGFWPAAGPVPVGSSSVSQGRGGSNSQPSVLETAALPVAPRPSAGFAMLCCGRRPDASAWAGNAKGRSGRGVPRLERPGWGCGCTPTRGAPWRGSTSIPGCRRLRRGGGSARRGTSRQRESTVAPSGVRCRWCDMSSRAVPFSVVPGRGSAQGRGGAGVVPNGFPFGGVPLLRWFQDTRRHTRRQAPGWA